MISILFYTPVMIRYNNGCEKIICNENTNQIKYEITETDLYTDKDKDKDKDKDSSGCKHDTNSNSDVDKTYISNILNDENFFSDSHGLSDNDEVTDNGYDDNILAQQIDYLENYNLKMLHHIANYYSIPKTRIKKSDLIEMITHFENNPENSHIVYNRKRLWHYIHELKRDDYFSKFIMCF